MVEMLTTTPRRFSMLLTVRKHPLTFPSNDKARSRAWVMGALRSGGVLDTARALNSRDIMQVRFQTNALHLRDLKQTFFFHSNDCLPAPTAFGIPFLPLLWHPFRRKSTSTSTSVKAMGISNAVLMKVGISDAAQGHFDIFLLKKLLTR